MSLRRRKYLGESQDEKEAKAIVRERYPKAECFSSGWHSFMITVGGLHGRVIGHWRDGQWFTHQSVPAPSIERLDAQAKRLGINVKS